MSAEETELVDAWRGGDARAGRTLIRRHFPGLYRFFAAKLDDKDAVADLVQRRFAETMRALPRFDPQKGSFRGYLFGIARHELIASLRKRAAGIQLEPMLHSVDDVATAASERMARRERSDVLVAALRTIPVEFQIVLELLYWEDMSVAEIAQVLEVPDGTVKSRLSRGRGHLRDALERVAPGSVAAWEAELRDSGRRLGEEKPG